MSDNQKPPNTATELSTFQVSLGSGCVLCGLTLLIILSLISNQNRPRPGLGIDLSFSSLDSPSLSL